MNKDKIGKKNKIQWCLYKSGGHYGVISIKEIIKNE